MVDRGGAEHHSWTSDLLGILSEALVVVGGMLERTDSTSTQDEASRAEDGGHRQQVSHMVSACRRIALHGERHPGMDGARPDGI